MKDPMPINLATTDEIRKAGWAAEARDSDGHLKSTLTWSPALSTNLNLKGLGEFISDYGHDCTVLVFKENLFK